MRDEDIEAWLEEVRALPRAGCVLVRSGDMVLGVSRRGRSDMFGLPGEKAEPGETVRYGSLRDADLRFFQVSWVDKPVDPASVMRPVAGYVRLARWEVADDVVYFQWHPDSGELNLVLRRDHPRPLAVMLRGEDHFNVLCAVSRWDRLLEEWGVRTEDLVERATSLRAAAEVLEV